MKWGALHYPTELAYFTEAIREAIGNGGKGIFYIQVESEIGKDERMTVHTFKIAKIHYSSDLCVYSNGAKHSFGHVTMPDGKDWEDAPEWVKSIFRNTKNFQYRDEQTILKALGPRVRPVPADPVKDATEAARRVNDGLSTRKEECDRFGQDYDAVMKQRELEQKKLNALEKHGSVTLLASKPVFDYVKAYLDKMDAQRVERNDLERLKAASDRAYADAEKSRIRAARARKHADVIRDRYFQKLLEVHAETLKSLPSKEDKAFGLA